MLIKSKKYGNVIIKKCRAQKQELLKLISTKCPMLFDYYINLNFLEACFQLHILFKSFYFAESSRVVYSQGETKRLSSAWCK